MKIAKNLVHLPWKEQHELFPDKFENCVARLSSQLKRLRKDPEILKEYDSIIQDQLQSGIIDQEDCAKRPDVGRVHYLPHHGVVRRGVLTPNFVLFLMRRQGPAVIVQVLTNVFTQDQP